ncbi:unnamed protein product [Sphagnum troendelagicum]|uniref:Lipoyl-binding domain-containing protein n=1 Tax=Sphagnum troendelagicum TaxID=128251 RepID=A0ABP0UZP7_9BRYO
MVVALSGSCCYGALAGLIRVQGESAKSRTAAKSMQVVASSRDIMSGCSTAHLYVTSCFRWPFECNSQVWHISAAAQDVTLEKEPQKDDENELCLLTPNAFEVRSLLMKVCDETEIAELRLKVGPFMLHMKRHLEKAKDSVLAVAHTEAAPVPSKSKVDSTPVHSPPSKASNGTSSMGMISSFNSRPATLFRLLVAAADEGLLFITSPKVGYFRKGRNVKGKRGKPLCEEGQVIREGQVVCYLEQLGTQQSVEAEMSGEVMKVLWEDGEPVGYGDPLIAIRPSFPGIKKLT